MSVGSNVVIGAGARVRETILLDGAELKVMHRIFPLRNLLCMSHSIILLVKRYKASLCSILILVHNGQPYC